MREFKEIKEMVDNLSFDIRAEVLIAELLEQAAIPRDKAILKAKGIHARPFSRDVLEVELFEDDRMRRDAIFFHVAREGLYDALPEGIFHTPKTQRNATEMVDEIKKQNQQREDARTFFLPIEEEFNRQRILVEQEERKTIGGFSDYKRFDRHFQQGLIVSFWKLTKELAPRQIAVLLHLLPISYKIAGNLNLTQECFELILNQKVSLRKLPSQSQEMPAGPGLGDLSLGGNFVVGSVVNECIPAIEVNIGPISRQDVASFVKDEDGQPVGKNEKILQLLYEFFIPADVDVVENILVNEDESELILDDSNENDAVLGFTSAI